MPSSAIARVWVRRNLSRKSLQAIEDFLRETVVGHYSIGETGSPRSGYWTTIEVTDRRDLDRIREKFPRLVDGWQELV